MNFERLLLKAKEGNADAVLKILEIYKPLLIKNAIVNGRFDEDLYQEPVSYTHLDVYKRQSKHSVLPFNHIRVICKRLCCKNINT